MASIHHQTRIANTLHASILETRQTARARAAPHERGQGVVDGLRRTGVVVVRLHPKGTAGEGARKEFAAGGRGLACARDGLGHDRAAACGLAPDRDRVGITTKGGDVSVGP